MRSHRAGASGRTACELMLPRPSTDEHDVLVASPQDGRRVRLAHRGPALRDPRGDGVGERTPARVGRDVLVPAREPRDQRHRITIATPISTSAQVSVPLEVSSVAVGLPPPCPGSWSSCVFVTVHLNGGLLHSGLGRVCSIGGVVVVAVAHRGGERAGPRRPRCRYCRERRDQTGAEERRERCPEREPGLSSRRPPGSGSCGGDGAAPRTETGASERPKVSMKSEHGPPVAGSVPLSTSTL